MKFKSLKSQIAFTFLSVMIILQTVGFIAIQLSVDKNARLSVKEQLEVGRKIFLNLLEKNSESLSQGARILAKDYGFRSAIGTQDNETILSALSNHQARIGADISIFFKSANEDLIVYGELESPNIKPVIASLIANANDAKNNTTFTILNQQPYQLVAVPVKAPIVIGWVVMGFEINDQLVQTLHRLSNLEVTFISKVGGSVWTPTASTLSNVNFSQLIARTPDEIEVNAYQNEIIFNDSAYSTQYVPIYEKHDQKIYAVLQRSINQATSAYQDLKLNLLLLSLIGLSIIALTIFYFSKVITKPISDLVASAKKLGEGDFDINIQTDRQDELGLLSRSFNNMTHAILKREQNIEYLAYFDKLTQLPNRTSFLLELTNILQKTKTSQTSLSVLVFNLNRFKQINTILGYATGDKILNILADRIKANVRKGVDFVARDNGDQFAILLPNTSKENALVVSQNLLKSLESPIQMPEQNIDLSASVGIASYPEHAENETELLSRAEMAMVVAKQKSTGFAVFDKSFDLHSAANLSLASELKTAIAENQLELYVQPKIDLSSGELSSLEALVRWKHPTKGYIFPDQFIPFAEQTGLIQHVTDWMLHAAAIYIKQWHEKNIHIPIAINISTRDLIGNQLLNKVRDVFNDIPMHDGKNLISLEITESSIMDDPVRALNTLDKLAEMNIKLSVDDFGTGYSSLSYLKKLPVNELKIDKSFVMNMESDVDDKIIVQSTISLGHNLGLKVVAEGIENLTVWMLLKDMGCDYAQGYYMARPMHANKFQQWLIDWPHSEVFNSINATVHPRIGDEKVHYL